MLRQFILFLAIISIVGCGTLNHRASVMPECAQFSASAFIDGRSTDHLSIIAVGDFHGNREALEFLGCLIDKVEPPVLVAYELPDSYSCLPADEEMNLCGSPWGSPPFDGRNSSAAYEFLLKNRARMGVDIIYFDPDVSDVVREGRGIRSLTEERERRSLHTILGAVNSKKYETVILFSGALRSSRDPYSILGGEGIPTLLMRLEQVMNLEGVSIRLTHNVKSFAWQCREICGPQVISPDLEFTKSLVRKGFHDVLVEFPTVTISPPPSHIRSDAKSE